jgi:hypothetical protein
MLGQLAARYVTGNIAADCKEEVRQQHCPVTADPDGAFVIDYPVQLAGDFGSSVEVAVGLAAVSQCCLQWVGPCSSRCDCPETDPANHFLAFYPTTDEPEHSR